ncbi:hypothetical protein WMY93_005515 [Mugilogobius chulae]|uniref:Uncharacterized protein n=1 Tax=Mugilogobius chulae TaxID=88201 RepID=A0AAW0PHA4_9GOBI
MRNCKSGLSLWLVVWMVLGKPSPVSACPQNCVCYPTPMTVSCQAQNFTAVPVGVPYESQRVFLQNNRITELRVGSFGFGTQVLWLFSNNITWIEAGAFSELRDLEELDLGDNPSLHRLEGDLHMHRCKLTALPHDIFHKLYSLQFLYLQENHLHFLQDDIFSDLINLSQLFLHGNRIRTLSENVFRGLVNLDRLLLHDNRIRQVNRRAFRDLGRLTMLFLFNNSLAELPARRSGTCKASSSFALMQTPGPVAVRRGPCGSGFVRCMFPHLMSSVLLPPLAEARTCASFGKWTLLSAPCPTLAPLLGPPQPPSAPKPAGVFEKASETVKAGLYGKGPSTTTSVVKYELGEEELALPKLDPEEYWANYGNEDSGITVRCFELECPPEFELPPSSSASPSVLSILSLCLLTVPIHLLFG